MATDVPILVVCRDRVTPLVALTAWLRAAGHDRIVLVDNDSSHASMLEYLAECEYQAVFLRENLGPSGIWSAGVLERLGITGSFVVTDPDIVPDATCPRDALRRCAAVLRRHPDVAAVGLGLRVDDLPSHYHGRDAVLASGWVDGAEIEPGVFEAPGRVPFALYRAGAPPDGRMLRLGAPYVARHATWYVDSDAPSSEDRYAFQWARRDLLTWGPFGLVEPAAAGASAGRNRGSTQPPRDSAWPIGEAPELVAGSPGHERALETPMFSILMPTTGDRPSLRRAVEALLAQDYERWELVIKAVDAGAARRQLPVDDRIVLLDGPDRNLTHAVNLAMARATGDVFNWANDDDVLLPHALSYVAEHLRDAMWLRAPVEHVDDDGRHLTDSGNLPWDLVEQKKVPRVAQPGVFWRREAVASIGNFDESVPLASDYEYYIRLGERWAPRSVDRVVARYRFGGDVLSLTQQHVQNGQAERIRARSAYAELAKREAEIASLHPKPKIRRTGRVQRRWRQRRWPRRRSASS